MSARRAFTVELTEEQIEQIEARVASGAYPSASEVVAAGVAELFDQDVLIDNNPEWQAFLIEVRETCRRIDAGLEPLIPIEEVRARITARRAAEDRLARHRG